jgi:hypothetical protein
MALQTYDCKNWTIMVAGSLIQGFSEDSTFDIEWESDLFTDSTGADGLDVTRNAQNDFRATVTLKLKQTSASNQILMNIGVVDSIASPKTSTSPPTVPVSITSVLPGGAKFIGETCYLKKFPNVPGGKDAGDIEYALRVPALIPVVNGAAM